MTTFAIEQTELDALCGLPHLAFRVYVLLRSWMDFGTGLVGGPRGAVISYRRLAEHIDVRRDRGSTAPDERPTKEQLRAAVAQLVRHGLLRAVKVRGPRFVFCYRLLLAKVCPDEEPHVKPAGLGRIDRIARSLTGKGFQHKARRGYQQANAGQEPQSSGSRIEKDGAGWAEEKKLATPWGAQAVQMMRSRMVEHDHSAPGVRDAAISLADVLKVRQVTEREMDRAFALARRCRKVQSVPAYVVGIIKRGEMKRRLDFEDAHAGRSVPKQHSSKPDEKALPPVQTLAGRERGLSAIRGLLSRLGGSRKQSETQA